MFDWEIIRLIMETDALFRNLNIDVVTSQHEG